MNAVVGCFASCAEQSKKRAEVERELRTVIDGSGLNGSDVMCCIVRGRDDLSIVEGKISK